MRPASLRRFASPQLLDRLAEPEQCHSICHGRRSTIDRRPFALVVWLAWLAKKFFTLGDRPRVLAVATHVRCGDGCFPMVRGGDGWVARLKRGSADGSTRILHFGDWQAY